MGKLYVVATPLGNLKDITLRTLEILKSVDGVIAEDSRVAHKLLSSYEIKKEIYTYHQHSNDLTKLKILELLKSGKDLALTTDAGTPGISDPGNELISFLLSFEPSLKVIPIPGASAVTTLLSVSGFPSGEFTFLGFFPRKKHTKLFEKLKLIDHTIVFFESPHRIIKTLEELSISFPNSRVVVGRELTKLFESIYRGDTLQVLNDLKMEKQLKGEIVVALNLQPAQ